MKRKNDRKKAPSVKAAGSRIKKSTLKKKEKVPSKPKAKARPKFEKGQKSSLSSKQGALKKKRPLSPNDEESQDVVVKKKQKVEALSHKEKKKARKIKKDSTGIQTELMDIYEKLRRKTIATNAKHEIIDKVLNLTEGKENSVIFKHDCVRVLEFCMKFGNEVQREKIFQIYKEHNIELLKSKYAKHLVKKMIKYGTKLQRGLVIKALYGNVKRLVKHKVASEILDYIYQQFADSSQRASLVEEFYGPHYSVFKAAIGRKLVDIFEKEPGKKVEILRHMKDALLPLASKDSVTLTIIHKPLLEFFTHADGLLRTEMIESLRERTVHMLHTFEGSRVTMNCLWFGSVKDRKLLIKSFKSFSKKICMEEYGHLSLLAAFDVVDDTVFVTKAILSEIVSELESIIQDQYGRKVLLYLLNGRDKRFFNQQYISNLEKGDGNITSKKSSDVRQAELRKGILDPLLKYINENIENIIKDKSQCQILLAAMEHSKESKVSSDVMNSIIELMAMDIDEFENSEDHVVFHPCAHWVIKKIIQQDKERLEKEEDNLFSELLVISVDGNTYGNWVQYNRGAFVVASLLESGIDDVIMPIKQSLLLQPSHLKQGQSKGMDIVMKLLSL
eukprot:gene8276-9160_t